MSGKSKQDRSTKIMGIPRFPLYFLLYSHYKIVYEYDAPCSRHISHLLAMAWFCAWTGSKRTNSCPTFVLGLVEENINYARNLQKRKKCFVSKGKSSIVGKHKRKYHFPILRSIFVVKPFRTSLGTNWKF